MRRGRLRGHIIVILLIGAIAVLYAFDLAGNRPGVTELAPAEVREYQGEQLSSIADFRENSIHGPQYVNASTYTLTIDGQVENRKESSYDALIDWFPHYRKVVTLYCVEGWDVTILDRDILLTYAMNNVTLLAEWGSPFQLVAEDRWGYKWVKWVTRIEVSDDENYRGYWESRGYANNGSIDRSFFNQG